MPNTCQQKGSPDGTKEKSNSKGPRPSAPPLRRPQKPLLYAEPDNDRFPTFSLSFFF